MEKQRSSVRQKFCKYIQQCIKRQVNLYQRKFTLKKKKNPFPEKLSSMSLYKISRCLECFNVPNQTLCAFIQNQPCFIWNVYVQFFCCLKTSQMQYEPKIKKINPRGIAHKRPYRELVDGGGQCVSESKMKRSIQSTGTGISMSWQTAVLYKSFCKFTKLSSLFICNEFSFLKGEMSLILNFRNDSSM